MPASSNEKTLFRLEFGGTTDTLTDEYIDGLFDLAEATYDPSNRPLIQQEAYRLHATYLLAQVELEVDYTANTASEKLSQRYERFVARVKKYEDKRDELLYPGPAVAWGGLNKIPPPVRRYPDDC